MILKPRSCSWVAIPVAAGLSPSATVRNTVPWLGSRAPAAAWALANAVGKSGAIPITSPVERISGPSSESEPAKRSNGSTASLTQTWPSTGSSGRSRSAIRSPEHDPAGELGERQADRLGDERHRPRGARVGLDHVQPVVAVDRELDVEQPDDAQRSRDPGRLLADLVEHLLAEPVRRQHAGRVAGVDPGLLDVLHDPGDPHLARRPRRRPHRRTARRRRPRSSPRGSGPDRSCRPALRPGSGSRAGRRRCRRSPSRARRARSWGGPAAGSRPRARAAAPPRRCSRWRTAAPCSRAGRAALRTATGPRRGRSRRSRCPRIGIPAACSPAASFSGVWPPNWTTTPSGLLRARRPRSRPRASAARSTAGPRCRSRSRPSPGCS